MGEPVVPGRRAGIAARRRRIAIVVAVPVLLLVVGGALTYTPIFGATEIVVEGDDVLTADAVTSLAGIDRGTNVVHLDTGAAERALEADPWVRSATVIRDLPSTIVVRISERVPVAVAAADVLAADGTVLPGADGRGLPTIETVTDTADPGDREAAAAAAGALTPVVRDRVETVLVEPDGDLVLILDDDVTVIYGAPGQDGVKAEALRALLRWVEDEGIAIESADVSVPSAPTARPVDGTSTPVP